MAKNNIVAAAVLWFVIACGAMGISCKGFTDVNENDSDDENTKIAQEEQADNEQQENINSSSENKENEKETYRSMAELFWTKIVYKVLDKMESFVEMKRLDHEKNKTVGFGNQFVYDEDENSYEIKKAPKELLERMNNALKEGDKQYFREKQARPHVKSEIKKFKNKLFNIKKEYEQKGIILDLPEPEDWAANKLGALLFKAYQNPTWAWGHTLPKLVKLELQLKDLEQKLKNGKITEEQAKKQKEKIENEMANAFSYYYGGKGVHDDGTYGRCYWLGLWYIGKINVDTLLQFRDATLGSVNTKEEGDKERTDSYIKEKHEKVIVKGDNKTKAGVPVKRPKKDKNGKQLYDKNGKTLYKTEYVDKIEATVEYKIDDESIKRNIKKVPKNKTIEDVQNNKEQENTKSEKKEIKDLEVKNKNATKDNISHKEKSDTPEIVKYKKLIEQDKTNYKAYSDLSYVYWKSGKLEEGIEYLGEIYTKNKSFLDDKNLGGFYFNVGSLREALGDKYKKQNKYKEAAEQYRRALNNFKASDSDKAIKRLEDKMKDLNKIIGFNVGIENVKKLSYFKIGDKIYTVDKDSTKIIDVLEHDSRGIG